MSVTLTKDATEITIPSPAFANLDIRLPRQARGRTHDGELYVVDKGVELRRFQLEFEDLTAAQKSALEGFFLDTANGSVEEWVYTDHDGNAWDVHFLTESLDFGETAAGFWDVAFDLEVLGASDTS